jgi:hypothetical protein
LPEVPRSPLELPGSLLEPPGILLECPKTLEILGSLQEYPRSNLELFGMGLWENIGADSGRSMMQYCGEPSPPITTLPPKPPSLIKKVSRSPSKRLLRGL